MEQLSSGPRSSLLRGKALPLGALFGLLAAALVAYASPGAFLPRFGAAALLLVPGGLLLALAYRWAGGGKSLAWMLLLAFALRVGIGIVLNQGLPVWGYQDPVKNKSSLAGYPFLDAYERDNRAWDLARSGHSLLDSFSDEMKTDQYGGLLALSAWVYRYLSPDAHRPDLILALGALVTALGLPFLKRAVLLRWNERAALVACWVYALYPDAIFFGSSQMREPFLMGLSAVAFWAALSLDRARPKTWAALAFSLLGMALFSTRVAVFVLGGLAVLFLLDRVVARAERRWQLLGWISLGLGAVLAALASWMWFRTSAGWDVQVSLHSSGWLAYITLNGQSKFTWLITLVYGLAQPVLPAAITETDALPLWRWIGIVRAAGWYLLAPFIVYACFRVWKESDPRRKRLLLGAAFTLAAWLVIASLRGGGDQTDNPRYRSLFIVWAALLAGWAVDWALAHQDAWLGRWLLVEGIFVGFFAFWYLSRNFRIVGRLPFWVMVAAIVGLSGLVLAGGWALDRRKLRAEPDRSALRPERR